MKIYKSKQQSSVQKRQTKFYTEMDFIVTIQHIPDSIFIMNVSNFTMDCILGGGMIL